MATGGKIKDGLKIEDKQEKTTKKKIIPVVSDSSDSSPSPEEPSTPVDSPTPSISSRFRISQKNGFGQQEEENLNKSLGQKLKNSYSKSVNRFLNIY
jgi:hypothetical protein